MRKEWEEGFRMVVAENEYMNHKLITLGKTIRQLRKERGLSQEDFAELCDLHRTYISEVEHGVRNVTVGTLVRIAQALGTTTSELTKNVEQDIPLLPTPRTLLRHRSLRVTAGIVFMLLAAGSMYAQSLVEGLNLETADAAYILQKQTGSDVSVNRSPILSDGKAVLVSGATPGRQSGQEQLRTSDSDLIPAQEESTFVATPVESPVSARSPSWRYPHSITAFREDGDEESDPPAELNAHDLSDSSTTTRINR
jgi:transcriptional regulator with XRE-family HTH domain